MAKSGNPSLRIDWFDGSVIEDAQPSGSTTYFDEESVLEKSTHAENKPIGFKRLLDISLMEPDKMTLEVSYRPGFWTLFDQSDLKGDFVVLIVKILDSILKTTRFDKGNSKIRKQLETRFLHSNFLAKLTDFLSALPEVKIVEKKLNIHLWNDVEAFFFGVVSLCEGLTHFCPKENKYLKMKLNKLLNVLVMSALGVSEKHFEKISEELFDMILILENEMEASMTLIPQETPTDVPTFKSMYIFPTILDIFPTGSPFDQSTKDDTTDLLKNISIQKEDTMVLLRNDISPLVNNGAYPSVGYYLNVQFRLLREDYFGPLREGISKYLENPYKTRHENIRVHQEVRILGTVVKNNKVGHLVDLVWKERRASNRVRQKLCNKQLMFGSLILFTCDNFHTILFATVLDSDVNQLNQGYITVSFQKPVSKDILCNTYLMVESEIFFEPYHQVLKVLQGSRLDKLPMQKYIVEVQPEIHPPAYLTPTTMYTLKTDQKEIPYPVLKTDLWPTRHMGLDHSQLEAYKFALTREFAVIQGPPGTGKTFLGTKIASIILENISLKGTPMLVICYTNNALDQFLEGILHVTDKIIRLGSQSKSAKLEPYSLQNVRAKMNCKHRGFSLAKRELEAIYKEISELQSKIDICETGIVSYHRLEPFLKIDGKQCKLKNSNSDRVINWLFEHLDYINSPKEEWGKKKSEKIHAGDSKIFECFSEKIALDQIENIRDTIQQLNDLEVDVEKNSERIGVFQKEAEKIWKRLDCFKSFVELHKKGSGEYKIEKVCDLYSLSTEKRWHMYFKAVEKLKNKLLSEMDSLLDKHKSISTELEDLSTQIDSKVLRTARVVGVTTTAAARRHQLIINMRSPIMIVEEAAEVLEAHIIASLTFSLQHLVLIGDHKQLRPTAANYRLAKECNFEVSLFERMISNGIHARTLTTQRRMRPNFAELLVPEVYLKLDSHESVLQYSDVEGMGKNLFFLTHEVFEDCESTDDSWVYANTFEAEWCVALTRYLLMKGYKSEEITVLATYNGQVTLIKKLSLEFQLPENVKITTVDNFQGEESRIVILSLVRSNRDGKIGFLSATNRICVALSRAKEGFYIFGNMAMLSKASPMWMSIKKKLIGQDAIGDALCTETPVNTAAELNHLCSLKWRA